MPLKRGSSNTVVSENIEELINSGHSKEQAAAIAYKKSGKDSQDNNTDVSNREYDINGYVEIKNNPISKVGVFPYSGSQIARDEEDMQNLGIQSDVIYYVYRPEEELSNEETINSFKQKPIIDEHEMLSGNDKDLTAPEKKGIHGTTGAEVYFDKKDGYLKSNLIVFSRKMQKLFESGKIQLSMGYRCLYEKASGVYNGDRYDFIQRSLNGNHIALVDEGRSGPEVAVLDHFKFTCDTAGINMADMNEEMKKEDAKDEMGEGSMTLEDCIKAIHRLTKMVEEKKSDTVDEDLEGLGETEDEKDDDLGTAKVSPVIDESEEESDKEKKKDEKKSSGMDMKLVMKEFAKRDQLALDVKKYTGGFDKAMMTEKEVAKYSLKKLNLACDSNDVEIAYLKGYLKGRSKSNVAVTTGAHAQDSKPMTKNFIDDLMYEGDE